MDYTKTCPHTNHALDHLSSCMKRFDFGTKEYELARKAFAFISAAIRRKEQADDDMFKDNDNEKTA